MSSFWLFEVYYLCHIAIILYIVLESLSYLWDFCGSDKDEDKDVVCIYNILLLLIAPPQLQASYVILLLRFLVIQK